MGYIIGNINKNQYLRPEAFGEGNGLIDIVDSYEGVMLGLTILLSDGNGRGGGDLNSKHPVIGTWAGDRIIIADESVQLPDNDASGLTGAPLQHLLLKHGTDMSGDAIEAILESEGEYSRLAILNPYHLLSLVQQAKLQEMGGGVLLSAKGRAVQLSYMEDLFAAFGEELVLANAARKRVLERGINKMAGLFDRLERYQVQTFSTTIGPKRVRLSGEDANPLHSALKEGAQSLICHLTDQNGAPKRLHVAFGLDIGTTVQQLYEDLFPGIAFERSEYELETGPEVAVMLAYQAEKGE